MTTSDVYEFSIMYAMFMFSIYIYIQMLLAMIFPQVVVQPWSLVAFDRARERLINVWQTSGRVKFAASEGSRKKVCGFGWHLAANGLTPSATIRFLNPAKWSASIKNGFFKASRP